MSERQLLCEGWLDEGSDPSAENLVFYPTAAYVKQGDKVWFMKGGVDALHEAVEDDCAVVESMDDLELVERTLATGEKVKRPKDGTWKVEGIFQLSDTKNANNRFYPRGIWERLIADDSSSVQANIKERGMVGHLEHPQDGRTDGAKGALVVTKAELRKDGSVWGEAELLDTPDGLILQEYTIKNVRWGVSSRGRGKVDETGKVGDDYMLDTWDAVMRPSTPGAFPKQKGTMKAEAAKPNEATTTAAEGTKSVHVEVDFALDEQSAQAIQTAERLLESSIDNLDAAERAVLFGDIVNAAERVYELKDKTSSSELDDVFTRLLRRTTQLQEATDQDLTALLDEALEDDSEELDASGGENATMIETLRAQIADSEEEADDLRSRLDLAESDVVEFREARDLLQEQLSEVEGKLAEVTRKLDLAKDAMSRDLGNEAVQDALSETLEAHPELERFREFLELMESPEQLDVLAGHLLASHLTSNLSESEDEDDEEAHESIRSTLPSGLDVRSSDDASPVAESKDPYRTQRSRGASLAARILAD